MALLVVQTAVDDYNYGSTQDEEIVVPWTMVTENHPPSPSQKTTTKLMVACIIGMTAAVASSALFFYSILDFSKQTSTEESFLLHKKDGTCVVQSGGWPSGTGSVDDDDGVESDPDDPFATCYVFQREWLGLELSQKNDFCWSRSYITKDGDWEPCKPKGYGSDGWSVYANCNAANVNCAGEPEDVHECGPPCTEFE